MRWRARGEGTFGAGGAAASAEGEEEEEEESGVVQTWTSLPTATARYLPQGLKMAAVTGALKVILPRTTVDAGLPEKLAPFSCPRPLLEPLRRRRSRIPLPDLSTESRVRPVGSRASVRTFWGFFFLGGGG